MKRFLLTVLLLVLGNGPCLAQKRAAWPQDSAHYTAYLKRARSLGTVRRDSALAFANKALQLAQTHGQQRFEAECYNQIGLLSAAYSDRVDYFFKALRLYEPLNHQAGLGQTYFNLAETVRLQSNNRYPKEVLEYAQKSLKAYQRAADQMGAIQATNMIGIYYAMTGQPAAAYQFFEDVKNRMVAAKMDSIRIMSVEINLANLQADNPEESLRRRLAVYAYFKRKNALTGPVGLGLTSGIAYSYRALKQYTELIPISKEGLDKAVELQNLGRQVSFHQYLHDGYKGLGNFEQALFHADKVRVLSDSISKQEDAGRIAEAQQKYENEKKQTQIEKQGRELLQKQLAIEQAENQRTLLSREKALLDRELALKTQRFATETAKQQLNKVRLINQTQRQQTNIQRLQLENLQKANETQQLRETQRVTQLRTGFGVVLVLIVLLLGGLFWRNRQLRRKNRQITAALVQGQTLERKRVAADLHDNLGSTLSSLQWSLQAINPTKLAPTEQAVWDTLQQQVDDAYTKVRLLSHNLLPEQLQQQGLPAALQTLVEKLNHNQTIRFTLDLPQPAPRFSQRTEFEVYSICLELANNIGKHAQATQATISLRVEQSQVHLGVSDNGLGQNGQRTDGRGLQNVRARVEGLGGSWAVVSEPGGGMQHRILVPVTPPVHTSSQT